VEGKEEGREGMTRGGKGRACTQEQKQKSAPMKMPVHSAHICMLNMQNFEK